MSCESLAHVQCRNGSMHVESGFVLELQQIAREEVNVTKNVFGDAQLAAVPCLTGHRTDVSNCDAFVVHNVDQLTDIGDTQYPPTSDGVVERHFVQGCRAGSRGRLCAECVCDNAGRAEDSHCFFEHERQCVPCQSRPKSTTLASAIVMVSLCVCVCLCVVLLFVFFRMRMI